MLNDINLTEAGSIECYCCFPFPILSCTKEDLVDQTKIISYNNSYEIDQTQTMTVTSSNIFSQINQYFHNDWRHSKKQMIN